MKNALANGLTAESLGWAWTYWQFDSDFVVYDIAKETADFRTDSRIEPVPPAASCSRCLVSKDHQIDKGQQVACKLWIFGRQAAKLP